MKESLISMLPALIGLVVLGITAALGFLAKYLHEKGSTSKVARVGAVLSDAARAAVLDVETNLKPKLDSALADGVLTDDEKKMLKDAAVKLVVDKLPGGLLSVAKGIYGALFDTVVSSAVEGALAELKAVQALTEHAGTAQKVEGPSDTPKQ